jgi:chromate transporter
VNILWTLFAVYFKIGLFTIGGGYAMIPLIQQEIVNNYHWINMQQFTDFIAVAESTPGPFAVNTSTFVGMKVAGIPGALATILGVTLPSFIIILLIARWMKDFADNKYVKAALYGMMPVVIALILSAVFTLFISNVLDTSLTDFSLAHIDWKAVVCCALAAFSYYKFKLHPILLICICAGFGLIFYGLLPMWGLWM